MSYLTEASHSQSQSVQNTKYLSKVGEVAGMDLVLVKCHDLFYTLASSTFKWDNGKIIRTGRTAPISPKLAIHYLEEYLLNSGSKDAVEAYKSILDTYDKYIHSKHHEKDPFKKLTLAQISNGRAA